MKLIRVPQGLDFQTKADHSAPQLNQNWTVEFVYSPFFEMLCSLHVLFHPEHHKAREGWAIETRGVMSEKLWNRLSFFDTVSEEWMGAMNFPTQDERYNDFNIIKALNLLESLSTLNFANLLLNRKLPLPDLRKMLVLKKIHGESLNQEQMLFIKEADDHKDELISLLKEYYYLHFHKTQQEEEGALIRTLQAHKDLSETMDLVMYVESLHPRIEACADQFSLHKYKRFDYKFADLKKLEIGISSFIDPHLLVGFEGGVLGLTIRAGCEKNNSSVDHQVFEQVHEDLVLLLKAVGDSTRLRMLKALYQEPSSTQGLAERLGITEAGISKHLKILHEADLVRKTRKGNFVLYHLDTVMIDRIPMNVYQYLDEQ